MEEGNYMVVVGTTSKWSWLWETSRKMARDCHWVCQRIPKSRCERLETCFWVPVCFSKVRDAKMVFGKWNQHLENDIVCQVVTVKPTEDLGFDSPNVFLTKKEHIGSWENCGFKSALEQKYAHLSKYKHSKKGLQKVSTDLAIARNIKMVWLLLWPHEGVSTLTLRLWPAIDTLPMLIMV